MKVIHVNKFYFLKGGAERYFLETMRNLEKEGVTCVPFSMRHERNFKSKFQDFFVSKTDFSKLSFSKEGLKTAGRMFYSFEAKKKIEKLIIRERPDIGHIHNIYHQISPSILPVFKKYHIPVVMTVEDYKLVCPNYLLYTNGRFCERCKKRKYYNAIRFKCLKNSYLASSLAAFEMWFHKFRGYYERNIDLYLCPSKFVRDILISFSYPKEKIVVLPHYGNYKEYPYSFTYDTRKPYIVFSGRLSVEKGLKYLLGALRDLPEISLMICGEGPEEKNLRKIVMDYRMKNVRFLGFLNQDDLSRVIRDAEFAVVPSVFAEPFGLVITEAFAYGKPVVAASCGGIPEIVTEGKDGYIFKSQDVLELKEKILKLWNKKEQILEMGKNARRKVETKYCAKEHMEKLIGLYQNLKQKNKKI